MRNRYRIKSAVDFHGDFRSVVRVSMVSETTDRTLLFQSEAIMTVRRSLGRDTKRPITPSSPQRPRSANHSQGSYSFPGLMNSDSRCPGTPTGVGEVGKKYCRGQRSAG